MAGRRWRWTMEVTQTPVKSLRRIDIRVAEADADEDSALASVTGFYGSAIAMQGMTTPSWSGPPAQQNLPPGTEQPPGEGENPEQPGGGQNPEPETPPPSGEETTDPPLPDRPEPTE
jgi:hypothetical protein